MKVVQVNTFVHGGAARAAQRLHEGLIGLGHDSRFFARHVRNSDVPAFCGFQSQNGIGARLGRRFKRRDIQKAFSVYQATRPAGLEMYSDDRSEFGVDVLRQMPDCDILNLHWVAGLIDYASFFPAFEKPVVWTLHDMNAFTGGCHYTAGCERFEDSCGKCPQLGSEIDDDLSRVVWKRKSTLFEAISPERMHIVTPSRWLKEQALASSLFSRFPVTVIPNGLDTTAFAPRGDGLKSALGIPPQAAVVLFVADSVDNQRKGFSLLLEAVRQMSAERLVYFLSIGGGRIDAGLEHHIHLGNISSDLLMSAVYSCADIFVIPSLEDNLPNTVLESMSCGTPVVGFDVGGIPDMVRPGQTGALVEAQSITGLSQTMIRMLKDKPALQRMGEHCRTVALTEYDLSVQAARYAELYRTLLTGGSE